MRRWRTICGSILAAVVAAAGAACGGDGGRLRLHEVGFSMDAPVGWRVSARAPDLCYRDQATGMVMVEPLRGEPFGRYVDRVSREAGARIVSRHPARIAGRRAEEVLLEIPSAGSRALRLHVDLGDRVVTVSFALPADRFEDEVGAIRAALGTIEIR